MIQNAREKLPVLARLFLEHGAAAAADGATPGQVHKFRLLVKRFRYALELFRPYYGPGLESRIDSLRALQDVLGRISDCATTEALIASRTDLPEPRRSAIEARLRRATEDRLAAFRAHWVTHYTGPAKQRAWPAYLERFTKAK